MTLADMLTAMDANLRRAVERFGDREAVVDVAGGHRLTYAELDAAMASLSAPGRLREAQEVVTRTAPSLQRLLASALADGGWFDAGHAQAVRQAAGAEDRGRGVSSSGFGMTAMRERAARWGGSVRMQEVPTGGAGR